MLLRIVAGAGTGALMGAVACGGGEFKADGLLPSPELEPDAAMVTMGSVPSSGSMNPPGLVVRPEDGGEPDATMMMGSMPAPDGGDASEAGVSPDAGKDADLPDGHIIVGIGVIVGIGPITQDAGPDATTKCGVVGVCVNPGG